MYFITLGIIIVSALIVGKFRNQRIAVRICTICLILLLSLSTGSYFQFHESPFALIGMAIIIIIFVDICGHSVEQEVKEELNK